ncbi:MAG: protoporphyrinogen oxidase [Blastocatellia bacterium]
MALHSIIIGAGISGLTAAYQLKQRGHNILLLENSARAGGVMQSDLVDGFLLERGPNSFRGTHELLDLVESIGLLPELVAANPKAPAWVYFQQQLHAVPMSLPALLTTRLLSPSAKLRLLREPFIAPRREPGEESIAAFVRRRLGPEILDRMVAPFLSGVYAGDPEQLSVQATFGKLAEFEATGSIARGAIGAARSAKNKGVAPTRSLRPYRLCSFRNGMQTLTDALAAALGDKLMTGARVTGISPAPPLSDQAKYLISIERAGEVFALRTRTLVIAAPAAATSQLLKAMAPALAALIADIRYTTIAAVPLAYRIEQLARPLDGFGFLTPRGEGLRTLGSIWNSALFPKRAPKGWVLLNNFIGGETDPEAITLDDDTLARIVHHDLKGPLGITGDPRLLPVTRWPQAIPQYVIGHAARVARIEEDLRSRPGLWLAGNYLRGVALGDCVKRGMTIADAAAQFTGNAV